MTTLVDGNKKGLVGVVNRSGRTLMEVPISLVVFLVTVVCSRRNFDKVSYIYMCFPTYTQTFTLSLTNNFDKPLGIKGSLFTTINYESFQL